MGQSGRFVERHGERLRYLIGGGWNTVFGWGCFWALFHFLEGRVHLLVIMTICQILSVTQAFLVYKLLVFRTRGRWIEEYTRCYVVYAGAIVFSYIAMPLLVGPAGVHPLVANTVVTVVTVVISFIGHRRFSFKRTAIPVVGKDHP